VTEKTIQEVESNKPHGSKTKVGMNILDKNGKKDKGTICDRENTPGSDPTKHTVQIENCF